MLLFQVLDVSTFFSPPRPFSPLDRAGKALCALSLVRRRLTSQESTYLLHLLAPFGRLHRLAVCKSHQNLPCPRPTQPPTASTAQHGTAPDHSLHPVDFTSAMIKPRSGGAAGRRVDADALRGAVYATPYIPLHVYALRRGVLVRGSWFRFRAQWFDGGPLVPSLAMPSWLWIDLWIGLWIGVSSLWSSVKHVCLARVMPGLPPGRKSVLTFDV